jgi:hypothetical protein
MGRDIVPDGSFLSFSGKDIIHNTGKTLVEETISAIPLPFTPWCDIAILLK